MWLWLLLRSSKNLLEIHTTTNIEIYTDYFLEYFIMAAFMYYISTSEGGGLYLLELNRNKNTKCYLNKIKVVY